MSNRLVDYIEYYTLSDNEYEAFRHDEILAIDFAESCRRREQDEQLIYRPGTDRGFPR